MVNVNFYRFYLLLSIVNKPVVIFYFTYKSKYMKFLLKINIYLFLVKISHTLSSKNFAFQDYLCISIFKLLIYSEIYKLYIRSFTKSYIALLFLERVISNKQYEELKNLFPIKYIKSNFFKIFYDFSNFYSNPILDSKDILWNGFVNELFIKNLQPCYTIKYKFVMTGSLILFDTFWLLDGQYEKIQKRKNHEKNTVSFLHIRRSFCLRLNYLYHWCSKTNSYSPRRRRILREEKLRSTSDYLKVISKKKNFPFNYSPIKHGSYLITDSMYKTLNFYSNSVNLSTQRAENCQI